LYRLLHTASRKKRLLEPCAVTASLLIESPEAVGIADRASAVLDKGMKLLQ
jgi:hypothetical protein